MNQDELRIYLKDRYANYLDLLLKDVDIERHYGILQEIMYLQLKMNFIDQDQYNYIDKSLEQSYKFRKEKDKIILKKH